MVERIKNRAEYKRLRMELIRFDHLIIGGVAAKKELMTTTDRKEHERIKKLVEDYEFKYMRPKAS